MSCEFVCEVTACPLRFLKVASIPNPHNSRKTLTKWLSLTELKNEEEKIREGGGAKAIDSQHKKSRLTARERIARLIDPGTAFFELGIYAAYEMYAEWGGAPAAGTSPASGASPAAW